MNRLAQGVVLLLLGGAVLRASLTDLHLRYVKESLQPFLIVAGAVLLAAGAMTLWYELRAGRQPPAAGHSHRESPVGWLLLAPVLGLLLVAPPALGSYSAASAGSAVASAQEQATFPPLPEADPVPLPVLDYAVRSVWDGGRTLAGRRVQLTGFLVTDRDGEQFLARLVLTCCAADARPVKVGLAGDPPAGLADDSWVEVTGRHTDRTSVDPINQATIPYLEVEQWRPVPAPRYPYE